MPRLDYDPLALTYNQRYRQNRLPGVERALIALALETGAHRVLEAGCGTGHWLSALSEPERHCFGLDFSFGMLQQAPQQKINLVNGKAEQFPFEPGVFDLIFCVNALHHFEQPEVFIAQAWESLKPGGCLTIIGQTAHDRRNRWYVYDYFPGTYETDLERFPTWGRVLDWMIATGFMAVHWKPVEWIHDPKIGRAVLSDPFLEKHATSQLALLSEEAYAAGIERIEIDLHQAESQGETLIFQTDLRLDMISAIKSK